jgi:hypothetical protein
MFQEAFNFAVESVKAEKRFPVLMTDIDLV